MWHLVWVLLTGFAFFSRFDHTCLLNHRVYLFIFLSPQNISILVVLMYSWQISANMKKYQSLGDVYYGELLLWGRRRWWHGKKATFSSFQFPKLIWYLLNFSLCASFFLSVNSRNVRSTNCLLCNNLLAIFNDGAECLTCHWRLYCK